MILSQRADLGLPVILISLVLAFPLFVVVVGVDSRWITRSLKQSYEWLQEADEIIANGGTGSVDRKSVV